MGKVPHGAKDVHEDSEVFHSMKEKVHTVGLYRVTWMVGWRGKQGLLLVPLPKLSLGV